VAASQTLPTRPTALPVGGLRTLLRTFSAPDEFGNPAPSITGRIFLHDPDEKRDGIVYLRAGRVYATDLAGFQPPIAMRMMSGGLLRNEQYKKLLALTPAEVGPAAVEAQYCTLDDIEDIHRQMILSSLTHMYKWHNATWLWEDGKTTNDFTIPGVETNLIVAASDERLGQWDALTRNYPEVTMSNAVPHPGPDWNSHAGESASPELISILQHVDGTNTVAKIAAICGFTRFEIGARLAKAIADGILLVINPDHIAVAADDEILLPDSGPRRPQTTRAQAELDAAERAVAEARAALTAAEARLTAAQEAYGKNH
jgi:hypothetical protein